MHSHGTLFLQWRSPISNDSHTVLRCPMPSPTWRLTLDMGMKPGVSHPWCKKTSWKRKQGDGWTMNNTIWSKFHLVTFLWLRFSNSQTQIQSCGPGPSPAPRHPCNVHFWANGVKQWPQTMVKLADPVDPLGPWGPVFFDHRVQRKRPLCSCPWNGQRDSFFQVRSVSSPVAWQSMTNSTQANQKVPFKKKKIRG